MNNGSEDHDVCEASCSYGSRRLTEFDAFTIKLVTSRWVAKYPSKCVPFSISLLPALKTPTQIFAKKRNKLKTKRSTMRNILRGIQIGNAGYNVF